MNIYVAKSHTENEQAEIVGEEKSQTQSLLRSGQRL